MIRTAMGGDSMTGSLTGPTPRIAKLEGASTSKSRYPISPYEAERAAKFHSARDRDQYIVVHARLRMILAGYLGLSPDLIEFGYRLHGKPFLASPRSIGFNLSHTRGLALVAIGRELELGIDLERLRGNFAVSDLASLTFAQDELLSFYSLSPDLQTRCFFENWALKEAYAKALGVGLRLDFRKIKRAKIPSALLPIDLEYAAALSVLTKGSYSVRFYELGNQVPDFSVAVPKAEISLNFDIC